MDRAEDLRIFLVPHTHWDREWYRPFDEFLARLVEMMDGLIGLLSSDDRFAHFHLDGQVAMVDDYLEVRPEREPDIRRLAGQGRISLGPWYTQMDEFLVSGESVVRNLEWGLARARELGGGLMVGYLPDQFGHIGQMPQLLRSAGIGRAVVWRGVPAAVDRTAFWWEAPDGSRVLAEYLAFGYSVGMRLAACRTPEELAEGVRQAARLLAPSSPRDRVLVPVGSDHQGPAARLPALVDRVRRSEGLGVQVSSIERYLDAPEPEGLPVWRGELRSAARAHLLPGVYSTRAHQKRDRARVEAALERWAEPLAALVPGMPWPADRLARAWRLLLWNGAHDSVCGCSVDRVAEDVDARYREALEVAEGVAGEALARLAARMRGAGTVWVNPSPFEREGVPGLGWRVGDGPAPPVPVEVRPVEGPEGRILAGDVELRVVDEGDAGDLYNFCPAEDRPPAGPSSLRPRGGGLVAGFEGLEVEVRADRDPAGQATRVRLRVDNRRGDRRLRLHVALDRAATGSFALSPFEVVQRPIRGEGGTEVPSATWPARGAVLAGGVAVLGEGVFEYEVLEDPPELAVTLLRCVGTISRPHLATRPWPAGPDIPTPGAQMVGEHRFTVAVRRGLRPEDLPGAWERLFLPLRSVTAPGGGDLPESGSLLEVSGAELSAVRRVGPEVEVRLWNPGREPRVARVGGRAVPLGPCRIEAVRLPAGP